MPLLHRLLGSHAALWLSLLGVFMLPAAPPFAVGLVLAIWIFAILAVTPTLPARGLLGGVTLGLTGALYVLLP